MFKFPASDSLSALKGSIKKQGHPVLNFLRKLLAISPLFLPGTFLVFLGVVTLAHPALLGAIVASLFLFMGLGFCYLTFKFIQAKKRVEMMLKSVGGQVVIQAFGMPKDQGSVDLTRVDDDKKIIIH